MNASLSTTLPLASLTSEWLMSHIPVLKEASLEALCCRPDGLYVDCTLGEGGHTEEILQASGPGGMVLGIDQDIEAIKTAKRNLARFGKRVSLRRGDFGHIGVWVESMGWNQVDGILLDLGVSSNQIDDPHRGFSFQGDGPLDMRMDRSSFPKASELINESSEEDLVDILLRYGEERWAQPIARAIVRERKKRKIERTLQLAGLVSRSIPSWAHPKRIHPATLTFQAFRIAINHELEQLERVLKEGMKLLRPTGRFCVISYHSLEDRIVKNFFRQSEKGCICPPRFPECVCGKESLLRVVTRRPIRPQAQEVQDNPRSRSAKLRVAERK